MKRFAIRFNAPVVLSFAIISLLVLVLDSVTGGLAGATGVGSCTSGMLAALGAPFPISTLLKHDIDQIGAVRGSGTNPQHLSKADPPGDAERGAVASGDMPEDGGEPIARNR